MCLCACLGVVQLKTETATNYTAYKKNVIPKKFVFSKNNSFLYSLYLYV